MKAALGKIVITPPEGPEGKPMAGYSRPHPARGKLDDVYARGVLMEDSFLGNVKKRILFISLDVLKVPMIIADYIKEKIKEHAAFGLGPGSIMIHGIHTHSAPDLTGEFNWPGGVGNTIRGILFGANRNDEYVVWMTFQVVKLVEKLVKKLIPAKVAWAKKKINKNIAINRRHPARRSKRDLNLMVFKDQEKGKIFGIMATYGCHPTTLSWENDKQSADYPGRVCYRIEDKSDNQIQAAFFTAPAGDINPITTCGTDFDRLEKNKAARQSVYDQRGTYEHTKKIGYILGDEALELARSIDDSQYYNKMSFEGYLKTIILPFKDEQPFVYDWLNWLQNKLVVFVKKYLLFPIALSHPEHEEPNFPGLAVKAAPFTLKDGYNMNVYTKIHYIRFAFWNEGQEDEKKHFNMMGVPGELFEDIEKRLLNKSPAGPDNTFIIQNANDWCAYLFPIKEYITQAGYEPFASTTPVAGKYVRKEMEHFWEEIEHDVQLGFW